LPCLGLNLNLENLSGSTLLSILCGETRFLVSWCVGDRCGMANSDEDRGRSRWLGAEDRRWSSTSRELGGRTIERSGDAMCGLYYAQGDEECGFLGSALKPRSIVSPVLASKPMARVLLFWPQNLSVWASKSAAAVWWFGPQNHCDGFLVWASRLSARMFVSLCLKTDERMKTVSGHVSTSGGLLHREASRARVSRFCVKVGRGATAGGARGIMIEVAWKCRKRWLVRWCQVWCSEVRPNYPSLEVIFLLAHRGILVFCFHYK
jgi:hypothetical protein